MKAINLLTVKARKLAFFIAITEIRRRISAERLRVRLDSVCRETSQLAHVYIIHHTSQETRQQVSISIEIIYVTQNRFRFGTWALNSSNLPKRISI